MLDRLDENIVLKNDLKVAETRKRSISTGCVLQAKDYQAVNRVAKDDQNHDQRRRQEQERLSFVCSHKLGDLRWAGCGLAL